LSKQLIVLCENYRREVTSLNLQASYSDIDFFFFRSCCGFRSLEWSELINNLPAGIEVVHVISGGCITGIPDKYPGLQVSEVKNINHCLHLVVNPELVTFYAQKGFYLVTPGWLSKWFDNLETWGFNREGAREFFHESAKAVLLLDTGLDEKAKDNLADFTAYIDYPGESVPVGLDYLNLLLNNLILKTCFNNNEKKSETNTSDSRRELADFAMALDLLNTLVSLRDEEEVMNGIVEIFTMLFAAKNIVFRTGDNEKKSSLTEQTNSEDSFSLEVNSSSGFLGYLDIIGIKMPQYKVQYQKLAGKIVNICGMAIDNARHYKMVKDLSDTDGLTSIANRRRLEEHLEHEWRRMLREQKPLTIVMADLDYFKNYNDLYGHQAGDNCLKIVAGVLNDFCRRPGDMVARYGGEEFTLILPDTELQGALELVEKIRQAVEKLGIKHEASAAADVVTVSFGLASAVPPCAIELDGLISSADNALFKAKKNGRNRAEAANIYFN